MRTKFYFSALETGWCFPESLSTATVPGRPRNPDLPISTIEQYIAIVNEGLARTALDAIDRENDGLLRLDCSFEGLNLEGPYSLETNFFNDDSIARSREKEHSLGLFTYVVDWLRYIHQVFLAREWYQV